MVTSELSVAMIYAVEGGVLSQGVICGLKAAIAHRGRQKARVRCAVGVEVVSGWRRVEVLEILAGSRVAEAVKARGCRGGKKRKSEMRILN